ncbi:MAG: NAD-dependent epimerase/dehydratase family protein [Acidimicrobiia bacterium]|jgi:UDP-glucose 4-epimerase|nr:NAD-dependent epimerase/dehydratase family protein [Acidimicrobiia bacterium]
MRVGVTGGLGFIGSNLTIRLLDTGHTVAVIDNGSTGRRENLGRYIDHERLQVYEADLTDATAAANALRNLDVVYHLAANADVRDGWKHPRKDHEQNVVATLNVLEGMRQHSVPRIIFSSTGSVYGVAEVVPTPENAPFPVQTSLYGASKLAAEGLIAAYVEGGKVSATIFRFVSILGPRYSHGHVVDFIRQLLRDPSTLTVLGDGTQTKSYLHVSDCVDALTMHLQSKQQLNVYNLGVDGTITVRDSIGWITSAMGISPELVFTGGAQGWIGDNPLIHLDISAMRRNGWEPKFSIKESVIETTRWVLDNQWVLQPAHH